MIIYAFLNEESILRKMYDSEFVNQFENVIKMMTFLSDSNSYISRFCFCRKFYNTKISDGREIVSSLITRKKDLYKSYQLIMNRRKIQWDLNHKHNYSLAYIYNGIDYKGSSVAEATEYNIVFKTDFSFLLNFSSTIFSETEFNIIKDDTQISVNCANCEDKLLSILKEKRLLSTYADNSKYSPRDIQTVLVDTNNFELTSLVNHGRKVYRRINHNELWCVDNCHTGCSAHLEVFSGNHAFKGTSHIDVIDKHLRPPKKNDIGRIIEP